MPDLIHRWIVLPIRRDLIVGQDGLQLLGLVDEETLRMALVLLDREREIDTLKAEAAALLAKLETLEVLERLSQC